MVTSTKSELRRRAAERPPKPPPTMTTFQGWLTGSSRDKTASPTEKLPAIPVMMPNVTRFNFAHVRAACVPFPELAVCLLVRLNSDQAPSEPSRLYGIAKKGVALPDHK